MAEKKLYIYPEGSGWIVFIVIKNIVNIRAG